MTALFQELEESQGVPSRELITLEAVRRHEDLLAQFFNTEEGKAVWRGAFTIFIHNLPQPPLQAAGIIAT
jgi:hypothetical protein